MRTFNSIFESVDDDSDPELTLSHNSSPSSLQNGSYCTCVKSLYDNQRSSYSLCKVLKIYNNQKALILDLTHSRKRKIPIKYLFVIHDLDKLERAKELELKIQNKAEIHSVFKTFVNTSTIMTLICIVFTFAAVALLVEAQKSFDALVADRLSKTTQCNITRIECDSQCNANPNSQTQQLSENSTYYTHYAIAHTFCDGQELRLLYENTAFCPIAKEMNISDTRTCYILDDCQGFYLYPPEELITVDNFGLLLLVTGYLTLIIGIWCGLCAVGEYVTKLAKFNRRKIKKQRMTKIAIDQAQ